MILVNISLITSIECANRCTKHETITDVNTRIRSLDFKAFEITTKITHIKCIRQSSTRTNVDGTNENNKKMLKENK